jgi:hypothetical protein
LRRLDDLVLSGRHLAELRAGALQDAVDRGGGGVEQLGDLGRPPLQDVPQDQDGALPGRQVLQGGDQRQPDALPPGDDRGGIGPLGADQGVGDGLQPRHFLALDQRLLRVRAGAAEPGRQRPPAPALQGRQAGAGRDPVQPGPQRRAPLEPVVGAPRAQVRFLDEVLGVVHRPEHAVAMRQQLAAERVGLLQEVLVDGIVCHGQVLPSSLCRRPHQ